MRAKPQIDAYKATHGSRVGCVERMEVEMFHLKYMRACVCDIEVLTPPHGVYRKPIVNWDENPLACFTAYVGTGVFRRFVRLDTEKR